MNRRGFLGSLTALLATAAIDPEVLIWRPGAKTIFIPSVGNQFVTMEMITRHTLESLRNNIKFIRYIDKSYDFTTKSVVLVREPFSLTVK